MTVDTAVTLGHRAFRAMLLAFAYPGRPQTLPVEGPEAVAAALIESTWEPSTPFWRDGAGVPLARLTNVEKPSDADLLLLEKGRPGALLEARRGTEVEPEMGASVIWVAANPLSTRVRLSGPGVNGSLDTAICLDPVALGARAAACGAAPAGVDLVLVDRSGQIVGLPRTTRVEALD